MSHQSRTWLTDRGWQNGWYGKECGGSCQSSLMKRHNDNLGDHASLHYSAANAAAVIFATDVMICFISYRSYYCFSLISYTAMDNQPNVPQGMTDHDDLPAPW